MERVPSETSSPGPEPPGPGEDAADLVCTGCGETAPPGSTWCEACGHELAVAATEPCTACGERVVSPEGYCLSCGHRQPREGDHVRLSDGAVVAVSDRGRRHRHNEDSVAIALVDGTAVLVVCDGVSSTPGSGEASSRAAAAACGELVDRAGEDVDDQTQALIRAVERAQQVATEVGQSAGDASERAGGDWAGGGVIDDPGPPSSTLVAVVARPLADGARIDLSTAWVGDSRAYWVGPDGGRRLTGGDHEIEGSLTRWLGADSVDPSPDLARETVTGPGHLVVCSDGLWRYAAEPGAMATLVDRLMGEGRGGLDLAEALVGHANHQGGHDNITVALWSSSASADAGQPEAVSGRPPAEMGQRSGKREGDR